MQFYLFNVCSFAKDRFSLVQLYDNVYCTRGHNYVYVITWSTVDYTSVSSIIHCRHVITILFHDCDKLRVRSVAASGENGVGKMLSTCSQYNRICHVVGVEWQLLFIVRLLSIVKI